MSMQKLGKPLGLYSIVGLSALFNGSCNEIPSIESENPQRRVIDNPPRPIKKESLLLK